MQPYGLVSLRKNFGERASLFTSLSALTFSNSDTRAVARLSFFSDLISSATFCSFSVNSESNACGHIDKIHSIVNKRKKGNHPRMHTTQTYLNGITRVAYVHVSTLRCSSHFSLSGGVLVRVAQIRWCATRWVTCM